MKTNLSGKVILITGAPGGMGSAIAGLLPVKAPSWFSTITAMWQAHGGCSANWERLKPPSYAQT
jgi:hypothetical protein